MNTAKIISEHETKKAAHAAGSAIRRSGVTVFVMSRDNAARFLGIITTAAWIVYK